MSIGNKTRFKVFKRDNFTCQYCGKKSPKVQLEVDHINPKDKGVLDKIDNLITSCIECNRGKSTNPIIKEKNSTGLYPLLKKGKRKVITISVPEKVALNFKKNCERKRYYVSNVISMVLAKDFDEVLEFIKK